MTMDTTLNTSAANMQTFTIRIEVGHAMLVHRHSKGRIHLYNANSIEMGASVPDGLTPPPPDWNGVEHRSVCDSRLRVSQAEICGRLGDKNHPRRLLCKHCRRIMARNAA